MARPISAANTVRLELMSMEEARYLLYRAHVGSLISEQQPSSTAVRLLYITETKLPRLPRDLETHSGMTSRYSVTR